MAENGCIREDKNGHQIVVLNRGTSYEGTAVLRDFRIIDFKDYHAVINHKETVISSDKIKQNSMVQLWHATDTKSRAEFHWHLTLVVVVLIMALMVCTIK